MPHVSTFNLRGKGCGLDWWKSLRMNQTGRDAWAATIDLAACDPNETVLEVKVILSDSVWQQGANDRITLPTNATGSFVAHTYPWFFRTHGEWGHVTYDLWSPQLRNSRPIVAYVPPSYYENTLKPYDHLLIMHDGQNLFDGAESPFGIGWMIQLVVIGVYNNANRTSELTYSYDSSMRTGGDGNRYLDFIQHTVVPWVAEKFRVKTRRENVGILGSSLGGLISCYAGWTRPSFFGKVGCMSSSFWWNGEDFNNQVVANSTAPVPRPQLYLDSGDSGPSNDGMKETNRVLEHVQKKGYAFGTDLHHYLDRGAQHSEGYWGRRFWIPMRALYPPSPRATLPAN